MLFPTSPERLCDPQGRPWFLWDDDVTLDQFRAFRRGGDPEIRADRVGKAMRRSKPDDVLSFVTTDEID